MNNYTHTCAGSARSLQANLSSEISPRRVMGCLNVAARLFALIAVFLLSTADLGSGHDGGPGTLDVYAAAGSGAQSSNATSRLSHGHGGNGGSPQRQWAHRHGLVPTRNDHLAGATS
jgi:hypothetical protein